MNYKNTEEVLHFVNEIKSKYKSFANKVILLQKIYDSNSIGVLYGWVSNGIYTIDTIFTNEEHRRKGIAKELIEMAINEAREKQCKMIIIYPILDNGSFILASTLEEMNFIRLFNYEDKLFMVKFLN